MSAAQPWIRSPLFDGTFILAPAFVVTAGVMLFQGQLQALREVPPWLWLLLIVGVDVSHVYSTLFRTYLDTEELRSRRALYVLTPLMAWVAGCLLYSADKLIFWRVLAYLAVFHFIRQQYGFMMIYARYERDATRFRRLLDKAAIYVSTLYPIVYWHCHRRDFDWFVSGDFFVFDAPLAGHAAGAVYVSVLTCYVVKEARDGARTGTVNIPKNLLMFGTAISWFSGIVAFNSDLAFTATNVIAHGVPYMALVWLFGHNQSAMQGDRVSYVSHRISRLFRWDAVPLYVLALAVIAFVEEAFWDRLIWRDHGGLFGLFDALPAVTDKQTLVWLVPLLAMPQATHYVLDAFIWRLQTKDTNWKSVMFYRMDKAT